MPRAARVRDRHECDTAGHDGGPLLAPGCATVLIADRAAARLGDAAECHGPNDTIVEGEPTVLVGDREAARVGDATEHGGVIVEGAATVLIGTSDAEETLRTAAQRGAALCAMVVGSDARGRRSA